MSSSRVLHFNFQSPEQKALNKIQRDSVIQNVPLSFKDRWKLEPNILELLVVFARSCFVVKVVSKRFLKTRQGSIPKNRDMQIWSWKVLSPFHPWFWGVLSITGFILVVTCCNLWKTQQQNGPKPFWERSRPNSPCGGPSYSSKAGVSLDYRIGPSIFTYPL